MGTRAVCGGVLLLSACQASVEDLRVPSADGADAGPGPESDIRDAAPRRDASQRQPDGGAPILDAAPLAWMPRETCPADGAYASVDTVVRATFPLDVARVPLGVEALSLSCDGVPIPGRAARDGPHLVFVPLSPLRVGAVCEATVDPATQDAVVGLPLEGTWRFIVDDRLRWSLHLQNTTTIARDTPLPSFVPNAGAGAVVSLISSAGLAAARSVDEGRSWAISTRLSGSFSDLDTSMAAADTAVHAVWRERRTTAETVHYARWDVGAPGFGSPMRLDGRSDRTWVASASVATGPPGWVAVMWSERCRSTVSDCEADEEGVFVRTSSDSGRVFGASQRIGGAQLSAPTWVQSGSEVRALWLEGGELVAADPFDGFAVRGRGPALRPPFRARGTPSGEVLLQIAETWTIMPLDAATEAWRPYPASALDSKNTMDVSPSGAVWALDVTPEQGRPRVDLRRSIDRSAVFEDPIGLSVPPELDAFTVDGTMTVLDDGATLFAWRGVLARAGAQPSCIVP